MEEIEKERNRKQQQEDEQIDPFSTDSEEEAPKVKRTDSLFDYEFDIEDGFGDRAVLIDNFDLQEVPEKVTNPLVLPPRQDYLTSKVASVAIYMALLGIGLAIASLGFAIFLW